MDLTSIKNDITQILNEYFQQVDFPENGLFVVGCSTSEIIGNWKGSSSNLDVGQTVYNTIHEYLAKRNINLAIQGCEHINRSLLLERRIAEKNNFEIVSVIPALHAGGATQVAAYQQMDDPVEVEHISAFGGLDIGGTEIGMHVKFVQIPIKLSHPQIGMANAVCLSSRPKLVGGQRAQYKA